MLLRSSAAPQLRSSAAPHPSLLASLVLGQYGLHLLSAPLLWAAPCRPEERSRSCFTPPTQRRGATASTAAGRLRCLCFEPCWHKSSSFNKRFSPEETRVRAQVLWAYGYSSTIYYLSPPAATLLTEAEWKNIVKDGV